MSDYTEKIAREVIESNKVAIKSNRPKIALKNNPELLNNEQEVVELEIEKILNVIKKHHTELIPFITRLNNRVQDITEETHFCAVYLLLCQTIIYWDSLFLLAENGNSSAMQLSTRTIKEALALAQLFSFEFANKEDGNLKKWFSGKIISHEMYRKKIKEFFKDMSKKEIAFLEETSKNLYQMESHSIHVAYTSVIECISPFTEDFDLGEHTKFKRTSYNLNYVKGIMIEANIALKFVYRFLLNDYETYNQLDKILNKYSKC
ncbi:hypothetical protein J7J13_02755 [bacterium]|nr:hypothetical protein [bacterium]